MASPSPRYARRRYATALIGASAVAGLTLIGLSSPTAAGKPEPKVYVCKYIQKPGVAEVLATGQNPILVSGNATIGDIYEVAQFKDRQEFSVVVAVYEEGVPEPECPTSPTTTPPPPTSTSPAPTSTTPTSTSTAPAPSSTTPTSTATNPTSTMTTTTPDSTSSAPSGSTTGTTTSAPGSTTTNPGMATTPAGTATTEEWSAMPPATNGTNMPGAAATGEVAPWSDNAALLGLAGIALLGMGGTGLTVLRRRAGAHH